VAPAGQRGERRGDRPGAPRLAPARRRPPLAAAGSRPARVAGARRGRRPPPRARRLGRRGPRPRSPPAGAPARVPHRARARLPAGRRRHRWPGRRLLLRPVPHRDPVGRRGRHPPGPPPPGPRHRLLPDPRRPPRRPRPRGGLGRPGRERTLPQHGRPPGLPPRRPPHFLRRPERMAGARRPARTGAWWTGSSPARTRATSCRSTRSPRSLCDLPGRRQRPRRSHEAAARPPGDRVAAPQRGVPRRRPDRAGRDPVRHPPAAARRSSSAD